jgi:hypothetical protein
MKRDIVQMDLAGNPLGVWKSVIQASLQYGTEAKAVRRHIYQCLTKQRTTAGASTWKYYHKVIIGEEWLPHPVMNVDCSNKGRVRHIHSGESYGYRNKDTGYRTVTCNHKKQTYHKRVHRLIMETWDPVGEILCLYMTDHQPQVDHINGVRDDNTLENLQWVTPSEHAFKTNKKK